LFYFTDQLESVAIFGGVIFGSDNKTTTLPRTAVDGLDNVDELLIVLQSPIDLVVVASTKIDHDVLVPEEEHDS